MVQPIPSQLSSREPRLGLATWPGTRASSGKPPGKQGRDEQVIRGTLGRLLFGSNDVVKQVQVLSGGEKGRMLYGKLILQKPNVLIMDEPTNHMDMESIESLNMALEKYKGTLIFVSHDRQFVSSLATQIIELDGKGGYEHYLGDYESYLDKKGLV